MTIPEPARRGNTTHWTVLRTAGLVGAAETYSTTASAAITCSRALQHSYVPPRTAGTGFDVSHIDSHIGALLGRPEFFDVYLELALDFGLPLRLPGEATQRLVGFPFRKLAAEEGAVFPDHLVAVLREGTGRVGAQRAIERALFELAPGVTEIQTHPAIDTDELRAACPDWPGRVEDHAYLRNDPSLPDLVERAGAVLIGYRDLRDLQRAGPG